MVGVFGCLEIFLQPNKEVATVLMVKNSQCFDLGVFLIVYSK